MLQHVEVGEGVVLSYDESGTPIARDVHTHETVHMDRAKWLATGHLAQIKDRMIFLNWWIGEVEE